MISRSLYVVSPLALALAWSVATWGCSATNQSNGFDDPTPSGAGGAGGKSGAGGKGGGGGDDLVFVPDAGSDALPPDDASCASTSAEAQLIPLDILILLDRSGSMDDGVKWPGATKALKDYVNSPDAAGVHVGIEYFPVEVPGFDMCDYTLYDNLSVPIDELPANAAALTASIDAEDPNGSGTPMYGAMKGAYFVATAYQDANPTHKVIVVFASDGDPNSCSFSPGNPPDADTLPIISDLAEKALNYNGVKTYVIAIAGSSLANLDQIAIKGGTTKALDVTQNINLFLDKMKEIQAAALPCDFAIPPAPAGQTFDKDLVQVIYTPSDPAAQPQQIPHADNLQDCGQAPGWYYDNNLKPTKIVLCPKSCQTVKADFKAKVNVNFGCAPDLN